MNQTHIHLLINHLPIIGSILGSLVLMYGIIANSAHTKIAAYFTMVISTLGAVIAYLTGEAAEDSVENIAGVLKSRIHEHEEFALISLIALIILGVASLLSMYLTYKKSPIAVIMAGVTLLISLVSFGLVARAGYLGGEIRHTELNPSSTTNTILNGNNENDKDSD